MLGNRRVRRPGCRLLRWAAERPGGARICVAVGPPWRTLRTSAALVLGTGDPAKDSAARAHTLRSCAEGTGPATRRGVVRWSEPDAREGIRGRRPSSWAVKHGRAAIAVVRDDAGSWERPGDRIPLRPRTAPVLRQPSRGGSARRSEHAVQRCRRDDLGSGAPTTPLARLCTGYRGVAALGAVALCGDDGDWLGDA
jgi:hypothetical protein